MTTTPPNMENSPEFIRRTGNRPPEELDPRWDTLVDEVGPFPGPNAENTEVKTQQMEEIANNGAEFEHEYDEPIYEKVYAMPNHADGFGDDEYNEHLNEYLTKGFWRRIVGYSNRNSIQVNKISQDYQPPIVESKLEVEELRNLVPENYGQVVQQKDALEGMDAEGGELKAERLSQAGIALDATAQIFELSHRADVSAMDIAEACKGMPEVQETIRELLEKTQAVTGDVAENLTTAELVAGYDASLAVAEDVRSKLVNADAPVQLTGAIASKLVKLEEQLRESKAMLQNLTEQAAEEQVGYNANAVVGLAEKSNEAEKLDQATAEKINPYRAQLAEDASELAELAE